MFNKNNQLPFAFALASTLAVLGLGYVALKTINPSTVASNNSQENSDFSSVPVASNNSSNQTTSAVSFAAPGIVPMGISVKINGSDRMEEVNKLLKTSFQKEFPGTNVEINTDGSETGIRLLRSGQIDLAAISRTLNESERTEGLIAVAVKGKGLDEADNSGSPELFYAYREPANMKVDAFLGHLFSIRGQEAMINR